MLIKNSDTLPMPNLKYVHICIYLSAECIILEMVFSSIISQRYSEIMRNIQMKVIFEFSTKLLFSRVTCISRYVYIYISKYRLRQLLFTLFNLVENAWIIFVEPLSVIQGIQVFFRKLNIKNSYFEHLYV